MSRSKAIGYPFNAIPSDIAPEWLALPFQTRALGPALWILGGGEPIPVIADWAPFLCMQLQIGGKERPNIVRALYRVQELGLLIVKDGFATCLLRVCQLSASRLPAVCQPSAGSLRGVREGSAASNTSESLNSDLTKRLKKEIKERESDAREDEPVFVSARQPLGEPPPGFVDTFQEPRTELSLEDQILTAWKSAVHTKTLRTPGSTKQATDGAAEVAKWLRENVRENETPLSAFQVALKQYVEDDKDSLRKASWPLKWLVERLPAYLAAKQPEKQSVSSPTHREWVPPDYEADNREAAARSDRERQEWFREHPEYRAGYEEDQRRMAEEYAAARKVVRIEDAPKPLKRAAPMTNEQRQERIRFLQAQAEQIRAANAAK
jgi:hypothetical protein